MIRMAALTTYQHHHTFLVVEMGLTCYSMSFHQVCIPIITKWRNDMYPKIYNTQSYCHWRGVHLPWVYLHSSLSATYLMYWCSRDVWSFGWGVHLPLVYLHSSISATYFMYWCSRDVWSFGRGVHLTLVYVHSAFTQHLFHISVIVTVSYCYSSLIVYSQ